MCCNESPQQDKARLRSTGSGYLSCLPFLCEASTLDGQIIRAAETGSIQYPRIPLWGRIVNKRPHMRMSHSGDRVRGKNCTCGQIEKPLTEGQTISCLSNVVSVKL